MKYEEWAKREDELGKLYPNRKRGNWPFNYICAGGSFVIIIVGMAACVIRHYGNFNWLFF